MSLYFIWDAWKYVDIENVYAFVKVSFFLQEYYQNIMEKYKETLLPLSFVQQLIKFKNIFTNNFIGFSHREYVKIKCEYADETSENKNEQKNVMVMKIKPYIIESIEHTFKNLRLYIIYTFLFSRFTMVTTFFWWGGVRIFSVRFW